MPADNVHGMRADTLALLKQLDAPVYRWPGGNFVSGYNWKDGIGDRDRRPPRKNPAWQGIEHNDFGLDEFMAFCRDAGHRAVHRGQQRPGRRRRTPPRKSSTPTAPPTRRWAGCAPPTATPSRTASSGGASATRCTATGSSATCRWTSTSQKHNEFAAAMRAVDPSIKLVAVGDVGPWSEGMLSTAPTTWTS